MAKKKESEDDGHHKVGDHITAKLNNGRLRACGDGVDWVVASCQRVRMAYEVPLCNHRASRTKRC
jgi:hypothetical protein